MLGVFCTFLNWGDKDILNIHKIFSKYWKWKCSIKLLPWKIGLQICQKKTKVKEPLPVRMFASAYNYTGLYSKSFLSIIITLQLFTLTKRRLNVFINLLSKASQHLNLLQTLVPRELGKINKKTRWAAFIALF